MATGSRPRSSGPSDPSRGPGWRQLRVGALLLVALAVAGLAIFFMDEMAREVAAGPRLTVAAAEARELEPGAPVWVAGVPAGRVTRIRFRRAGEAEGGRILIRAELRSDAAGLLRSDAAATVRIPSLLAPAVLAIDPGSSAVPLDVSDTLTAVPQAEVRDVLARADSLAGRLEELRPLGRRLARRLEEGPGSLAALRGDPATVRRLRAALRGATGLAAAAPGGSAGLLGSDPALGRRWDRIRERARRMAPGTEETAALAGAVERLAARLSRLEARLDSAGGTLGRLAHDEALERERRLLEARMDSVRAELLANPFRWLRIRLF